MDKEENEVKESENSAAAVVDQSHDLEGWEIDTDDEVWGGEGRTISDAEWWATYARDDLEKELCDVAVSGDIPLLQSLLAEKNAAIAAREPYFTKKHFAKHCLKALCFSIVASTPNKLEVIKTILSQPLFDQDHHGVLCNIDEIYHVLSENNLVALESLLNKPAHFDSQNKYGLAAIMLAIHSRIQQS